LGRGKHKRQDRYWQIHHRAHTREAADFQKNLLRVIRWMGSPWPAFGRGRPPVHSWSKLVFLVAFMVYLDCPLRFMESLAYTLKLPWHEPIPDHTTIYRAMRDIPNEYLERVLAETVRLCIRVSRWNRKEGLLACDSSGVETDRYEKAVVACRWRRRKRYVTLHIIAILDIMVVAAVQVTSSRTRDSPTYRRMVKQMMRTGLAWEVFGGFLNADRAYDADENCRLTYELGSQPNIKQRETHGRGKRFRRRAAEEFNKEIYRYRGLVEGVFGAYEVSMHGLHTRYSLRKTQQKWGLLAAIGWNLKTYSRLESAATLGCQRKPILATKSTT